MKEQVSDMIRKSRNATRFLIDSERRAVYRETEGVVRDRALSARAGKIILEGPVIAYGSQFSATRAGVVVQAGPVVPF